MDFKKGHKKCVGLSLVAAIAFSVMLSTTGSASAKTSTDSRDAKLERMEAQIKTLVNEVNILKKERQAEKQQRAQQRKIVMQMKEDIGQAKDNNLSGPDSAMSKMHFGGYGEMHANFGENGSSDQFDLHRLVFYLGYDFNEWIKLHSEFEVEHAFVSSSSGGEVVVEQMFIDFLINSKLNFRAGRILTPLGIVNKTHEPPTFNGVERPAFATYIIPTTWSSDGVGIFGSLLPCLDYELYVVGGLDGSGFSALKGIRDGRIKERPSLQEPAVTGRLDIFPLLNKDVDHNQKLRIGLSGYYGGLNNGNKGANPMINGEILIYSADFEYSIDDFDFRGAIAHEIIDDATGLGAGTAKQIFGFYTEAAHHFMPDSWKTGKLKDADAIVFVRYDLFDTQHKMSSGVSKNPAGERQEVTIGVGFFPVHNLVIKADYQLRFDDTSNELDDKLNVGIGWEF